MCVKPSPGSRWLDARRCRDRRLCWRCCTLRCLRREGLSCGHWSCVRRRRLVSGVCVVLLMPLSHRCCRILDDITHVGFVATAIALTRSVPVTRYRRHHRREELARFQQGRRSNTPPRSLQDCRPSRHADDPAADDKGLLRRSGLCYDDIFHAQAPSAASFRARRHLLSPLHGCQDGQRFVEFVRRAGVQAGAGDERL